MSCPNLSSQWHWPWNHSSAYQSILKHVLATPTGPEIPLRKLYQLNCMFGSQYAASPDSVLDNGSENGEHDDHDCNSKDFWKELDAELSRLPYQPTLPSTKFSIEELQRCFPPELLFIDVNEALYGLDQLTNLEYARRKEVAFALKHFGIERNTLEDDDTILNDELQTWLDSLENREQQVTALYTHLYTSLRNWIFFGELERTFHPRKSMNLLNTLYPPFSIAQPTSNLTQAALKLQRNRLLYYIDLIEIGEKSALQILKQQPGTESWSHNWSAISLMLKKYSSIATSIISDSRTIVAQDRYPTFANTKTEASEKSLLMESPKSNGEITIDNEHLPIDKPERAMSTPGSPKFNVAFETAFNRLSRGLKTVIRSAPSTRKSSGNDPQPEQLNKTGVVRKIKSMSAVATRNTSISATK